MLLGRTASRGRTFRTLLLTSLVASFFSASAKSGPPENLTYWVGAHETLSEILYARDLGPLYGKNGTIAVALRLNPGLKFSAGNIIFPNQKIILPAPSPVAEETPRVPPVKKVVVCTPIPVAQVLPRKTPPFRKISSNEKPASTRSRRPHFSLSPSYSFLSLSTEDSRTGGKGTLASNLAFDVTGRYFQDWTENFSTFVGARLGYVSFEPPTVAGKTLSGSSKILSGISIGVATNLSERTHLTVEIGEQKELFTRAVSTAVVTADAVSVPEVRAKISYDLVKLEPYTFGIAGSSAILFPASTDGYSVKLGTLYGASFLLKEAGSEPNSNALQTEAGVTIQSQDTSLVTQKETNYFLNFTFNYGGTR